MHSQMAIFVVFRKLVLKHFTATPQRTLLHIAAGRATHLQGVHLVTKYHAKLNKYAHAQLNTETITMATFQPSPIGFPKILMHANSPYLPPCMYV